MKRPLCFTLIAVSMFWGCCTKKDCSGTRFAPLLTFHFKAPSHKELEIKFERFVPDDPTQKDSLFLITGTASSGEVSKMYEYNFTGENFFLSGCSYVITNTKYNFRDTLHRLSYSIRTEQKGCSKYMLSSSYCDYYDQYHLENVSFIFRGRKVNGVVIPDTLILK